VRLDLGPVAFENRREFCYRLTTTSETPTRLSVAVGQERYEIPLFLGRGLRSIPRRLGADEIRVPSSGGEPGLTTGCRLLDVRLNYPPRLFTVWGKDVDWFWVFFGLTLGFGLLFGWLSKTTLY